MKFDSSTTPTAPTPQQLTELNDVLVSATELHRIYGALARHPRVITTPGSNELFELCLEQVNQDTAVLDEQLESLQQLARSAPLEPEQHSEEEPTEGNSDTRTQFHSFPDVEPADSTNSVFDTVKKAFHLEDFFHQQLTFSLASAQERKHLKLELQLKMIILSAEQRCRLLDDRYSFVRSKSPIVQGLRRQTTRILSRFNGETRNDID